MTYTSGYAVTYKGWQIVVHIKSDGHHDVQMTRWVQHRRWLVFTQIKQQTLEMYSDSSKTNWIIKHNTSPLTREDAISLFLECKPLIYSHNR